MEEGRVREKRKANQEEGRKAGRQDGREIIEEKKARTLALHH